MPPLAPAQVLQREPHYRATIVGSGSEIVERLLTHCEDAVRARIEVRPRVPQAELLTEYQQAQIILVSSRSESFHIASAAGLCCGCSVVGPATIPSILWFTASDSGAAATSRSVNDLADAACEEIAAWRSGHRAPQQISARWIDKVTVPAVSKQFIELLGHRKALDSKSHALRTV